MLGDIKGWAWTKANLEHTREIESSSVDSENRR